MENRALLKMQQLLEEAGYAVIVDPTETLSIALPLDGKGRSRALLFSTEEAPIALPLDSAPSRNAYFIQLLSVLPFRFDESNVWEVLRVLNFFNRALPAPGFILDEGSHKVLFRYSFLEPQAELSKDTLLSLIGMMLLWLDSASPSIEEVALGKPMMDAIKDRIALLS